MNGIGKMRGYFTQKELKEFAAETEKELIHETDDSQRRRGAVQGRWNGLQVYLRRPDV